MQRVLYCFWQFLQSYMGSVGHKIVISFTRMFCEHMVDCSMANNYASGLLNINNQLRKCWEVDYGCTLLQENVSKASY